MPSIMLRRAGKNYSALIPDVLDTASLPGGIGWVTGTKRRHSYDAYEDSGKRSRRKMWDLTQASMSVEEMSGRNRSP